MSAGISLLLVSCDSGSARKISSFDELPDPTADTLSGQAFPGGSMPRS